MATSRVDLSRVSIGIKTFLRDESLLAAIRGIQIMLPEVKMIIADCGDGYGKEKIKIYQELIAEGHRVIYCPFDYGFGAMSNAIVNRLETPYLLVGSDDFDFGHLKVREGIEKLVEVLDHTDVDIASGRVNNRPYEFDLQDDGDTITEIPVDINMINVQTSFYFEPPWYIECDLTVNYSLIRKEVFNKLRWLDAARIGNGEHGAFFLLAKRSGFKTVYVPRVNISELKIPSSQRYQKYRNRALEPDRLCFDAMGVKKWVLGSGVVDYEKKEEIRRSPGGCA